MILGEQNLRQIERKICQNLNHDKIMDLIKYTLILQFSV